MAFLKRAYRKVSITRNRDFAQLIELLFSFVKRDLKARYKNTFLGIAWMFIQPFLLALIIVFIKGRLNIDSKSSYLDMFAVLIPWQFFVNVIQRGIFCLEANQNIIHRIKFPIILLPVSVIITSLIDSTINIIIYFILRLISKTNVFSSVINLYSILLISTVFIFALCLFLITLQSFIPDLRFGIPYLTKLSLLTLPILFNENILPSNIGTIYKFIPIVWMINASKDLTISGSTGSIILAGQILIISVVSLIIAVYLFKRVEKYFILRRDLQEN